MADKLFWDAAFSSKTDKWTTPDSLIKRLACSFTWDLDVCSDDSRICHNFYTKNGLLKQWHGLCWMNPPYGDEIGLWVKKAKLSSQDATIVCLLPARTDTKWWQDNVPEASLVVFIKGRLKFSNYSNSAPFPSAFVVFGRLNQEQEAILCSYGWNIQPRRFDASELGEYNVLV